MTARERTPNRVGYADVAVCLKGRPEWKMQQWTGLDEAPFQETYLIRPDELLVSAGAESALDDGWEFVKKVGRSSLYQHIDIPASESPAPMRPRSGASVMELVQQYEGINVNDVYCLGALRAPAAEPAQEEMGVDPFRIRVAPRYQGLGAQAQPAKMPPGLTPPGRHNGRAVEVAVVDTGLAHSPYANDWLAPCIVPSFLSSADVNDPPDLNRDGRLDGV